MARTVLVVEDSDACASTLEIALSSTLKVHVLTVSDGEAAWKILEEKSQRIHALITDLDIPGIDGFQLIERLRNQHGAAAIPIIVTTGSTDPRTPERARTLGVNAFFAKPYSPARVSAELERLLDDFSRP